MSLLKAILKAILHKKEHRKPHLDSRAFDYSCRNHGSCCWCFGNRMHKQRILEQKAEEELENYRELSRELGYFPYG